MSCSTAAVQILVFLGDGCSVSKRHAEFIPACSQLQVKCTECNSGVAACVRRKTMECSLIAALCCSLLVLNTHNVFTAAASASLSSGRRSWGSRRQPPDACCVSGDTRHVGHLYEADTPVAPPGCDRRVPSKNPRTPAEVVRPSSGSSGLILFVLVPQTQRVPQRVPQHVLLRTYPADV